MRHKLFTLVGRLAIALPGIGILAQPTISVQALSSAVARAPGMPGSGIAQGSIFSIYGSGLGPTTWIEANQFPLPTTLGGTSVTVTVQGTSVPAIVLGADSAQVNALLPSSAPIGNGTFTVTYNKQTSAPAPIQVVGSAFGIYTFNEQGTGQAIATDANYQVNTIIHVFHPNDYVVLWGTGLGAISGNDAAPPPVGNLPTQVTVYVGNIAANVSYQGRSGCCSGLDQINFQVPAGVTGCYVPVAVETGGITGNIGNFATIAVAENGDTCTDSIMGPDLVNQLAAGKNVSFGYVRLYDKSLYIQPGVSSIGGTYDFGAATFSQYTPATAGLAQYGVSAGYCAAMDCSYGCGPVMMYTLEPSDTSPAQLDAGALTVGFAAPTALTQVSPPDGFYFSVLSIGGRYLWPSESYPVAGSGGAAVGPFSVTDVSSSKTAATLAFTGITPQQSIPLASDLALQWTGGDPALQNGTVTILATSLSQDGSQNGLILCTAPAATQSFTIPKRVLAALPASGSATGYGQLSIGQYNTPTSFTATGLTRGIITDIFNSAIWVNFQ